MSKVVNLTSTKLAKVRALHDRLARGGFQWRDQEKRIAQLIGLASAGLPRFAADGRYCRTVRRVGEGSNQVIRPEGDDLRYAAIVALGVACLPLEDQAGVLGNAYPSAAELALNAAKRAEQSVDIGAVGLAAWAAAEAAGHVSAPLCARVKAAVTGHDPIETVACAWALSAALAAGHSPFAKGVAAAAAARLMEAHGKNGIFPHVLPASALGRFRAHVGCFADQVYPIQALARFAAATGNAAALRSAGVCAQRICELQGAEGQWWWHYDSRDGSVVEGYPVYSVHQHAMAPMALFDLLEAGGQDFRKAIAKGVAWLYERPESKAELVSGAENIVWRKIGRREPQKLVRKISAVTTSILPGFRLPGLSAAFPATEVDYECRPYEFGWLLYAWLAGGAVSNLSPSTET